MFLIFNFSLFHINVSCLENSILEYNHNKNKICIQFYSGDLKLHWYKDICTYRQRLDRKRQRQFVEATCTIITMHNQP